MGSIFDVKDRGELGRGDVEGGGVMDLARGVAWLDVVGDEPPGEEGCVEEYAPLGLMDNRVGTGRCCSSGVVDSSILRSIDCNRLGPPFGVVDDVPRAELGPASELLREPESDMSAAFSAIRRVRGRFNGRSD